MGQLRSGCASEFLITEFQTYQNLEVVLLNSKLTKTNTKKICISELKIRDCVSVYPSTACKSASLALQDINRTEETFSTMMPVNPTNMQALTQEWVRKTEAKWRSKKEMDQFEIPTNKSLTNSEANCQLNRYPLVV